MLNLDMSVLTLNFRFLGVKPGEAVPLASDWLNFHNKEDKGVAPKKGANKKKFNKKGAPLVNNKALVKQPSKKKAAAFVKGVDKMPNPNPNPNLNSEPNPNPEP